QMHYLNATDGPLTVHVEVSAYALEQGKPFTQTSAYVTYNGSISIAPHEINHLESENCQVPGGAKFWTVTSHSHKQSIMTDIKDGSNMVFQSNDWEHPGTKDFMQMPFYTFSNPMMTFECTYNNTGDNANRTIKDGTSAQTDEMCMAIGYF